MISLDRGCKRFWWSLIGVVVAYAIAAQSLLIVVAGFSPLAQANENSPGFQLCVHDSQGVSELPADNSDHTGCTHCIFCFAGSQHAMIGAPVVGFQRVYVEVVDTSWVADRHTIHRLPAHSIANPRGPPLRG
jgi:hypothetical protein